MHGATYHRYECGTSGLQEKRNIFQVLSVVDQTDASGIDLWNDVDTLLCDVRPCSLYCNAELYLVRAGAFWVPV